MADITINDTSGGLSTLSPTVLFPNQCNEALNVEWFKTMCGERRKGHAAITLGGGLETCTNIPWMYRHLPTNDEADAQLWGLGLKNVLGVITPVLAYKDTTWHTVTMPDALNVASSSHFKFSAASLNGKMFFAYDSPVDRLHVFIPGDTALRRTGLAEPAAPTAAETGGAGSIDDTRTYRVRYTEQISGTTVRRSEPSAELSFTPTSADGVTVTKPATISEGETHWELEAAKADGIWYRIATTAVGTSTYNDTIADDVSYSTVGTVSEDVGDYTLLWSAKYLSVDDDRLLLGNSFEDTALSSRLGWTPVGRADGVGNDERLEADTDPFVDLDTKNGGEITTISQSVNGYVYVGKHSHIYQGLRTRNRERAYNFLTLTKERGTIPGTMVEALDNNGHPTLFALDRDVGPIRIGGEGGGVQTCGNDLVRLWELYGTYAVSNPNTGQKGVYYRKKKQVQWVFGTVSARLVLHTQHLRDDKEHGFRGGWAFWTLGNGNMEGPLILFADNVEAGIARSLNLVPYVGMAESLQAKIWQCDTGYTDAGSSYIATLTTRELVPTQYTHDFEIKEAALYGLSASNFVATVRIDGKRADRTAITRSVDVDFSGVAPEFYYEHGHVIRRLDSLGLAECNTVAVTITDQLDANDDPISQGWGIDSIVLTATGGQTRGPKR